MNPIRTFVTICVFWVAAYLTYDGGVRLVHWIQSPPAEPVRIVEPVAEVAVKEAETDEPEEAEPQADIKADKPVVLPTKPAAVAQTPSVPAAVAVVPTKPAPVEALPAKAVPAEAPVVAAKAAAPEPVKPAAAAAVAPASSPAPVPAAAPSKVAASAPASVVAVAAAPASAPNPTSASAPAAPAKAAASAPTFAAAALAPASAPALPATSTSVLPVAPVKAAAPAQAPVPAKAAAHVAAVVAVAEPPPVVAAAAPTAMAAAPATATALQPKEAAPTKAKSSAEKAKDLQLTIKEIQFTGVTMFPTKELSAAVGEFVGKELTVEEAFAIPAKVTNLYKRRNHMAIATLVGGISPDGVLTVGVVEMQMTQTQAEKELAALPPTPAAPVLAPPPPPPSVAPPTKADADSETDYILKNYAKKSRQYEIVADNYGYAATGSTRIGASFAFDGDRFSLTGIKSQGSDYLRMAVRWATGIDGLKLGASLSHLNYHVVSHLETAIYQSGDAARKSVDLIYELANEPGQISSLGLHLVSKSINSMGLNLPDSASLTSRVPTLEWKGMLREMIPGGSVFTYDTIYAHGHVDTSGASTMSGLDVPEGLFSKLRFDGTVMQPLGGLGSVYGRLSLQKSTQNLDPSERFYLGGPLGVRAYGVGDGAGSEGGLMSLEFRQRLAAGTTLSEFYDWGSVRQVRDVNPPTVLKGYGLSLSQDVGGGVTLKGTWARSTGQAPDPTLPQNNDEQHDRNRFWLTMESRF